MFKKLVLCAALGAALVGNACADDKVLRMATESAYAPFEFYDADNGKTVGFDIDLLDAIAKHMGRKLEVVSMGFDAIIPSLLTNTTDVGVAAITITEERAKRLQFSSPYYESGLSTLIRAEDKDKIKSIKDLENCTICAQIGTSGSMRAAKVPGAKVKNFNNVSETFLELKNKGCDAVIGDRPVNSYFLTSRPQQAADYYHLPEKLNTELFGIAIKKGNKEMYNQVEGALQKMKSNGEYAAIYKKWFGEEPPKM